MDEYHEVTYDGTNKKSVNFQRENGGRKLCTCGCISFSHLVKQPKECPKSDIVMVFCFILFFFFHNGNLKWLLEVQSLPFLLRFLCADLQYYCPSLSPVHAKHLVFLQYKEITRTNVFNTKGHGVSVWNTPVWECNSAFQSFAWGTDLMHTFWLFCNSLMGHKYSPAC